MAAPTILWLDARPKRGLRAAGLMLLVQGAGLAAVAVWNAQAAAEATHPLSEAFAEALAWGAGALAALALFAGAWLLAGPAPRPWGTAVVAEAMLGVVGLLLVAIAGLRAPPDILAGVLLLPLSAAVGLTLLGRARPRKPARPPQPS